MTPNGAVGFTLLVIVSAFIARDLSGLFIILAATLCFALASRRALWSALMWSCGIVLPLARPGVVAGMTLLFILAIRELGSSLFL